MDKCFYCPNTKDSEFFHAYGNYQICEPCAETYGCTCGCFPSPRVLVQEGMAKLYVKHILNGDENEVYLERDGYDGWWWLYDGERLPDGNSMGICVKVHLSSMIGSLNSGT